MRRLKMMAAALTAALAATATMAQGPAPQAVGPAAAPPPAVPVTSATATTSGAAPLTRENVEAWLDGIMPYALARGDIAGGVVVVVKDGQVLVQKGYGFDDVARRRPVSPDRTLFRPGSVSKLLTWTAVMQQVEAGKLNLDADVNQYLDFKIPPFEGKPITLRNIMTHTAGFEETARNLIAEEPETLGTLGDYLKNNRPERVFAPGTTPAYSNYATALAGYIVERVSGTSFDDYTDRNVMAPIGMTRSSFRQPLPDRLKGDMSLGYPVGSQKPKPFEIVIAAPAGSLSATGADMGRFMIAHLNDGAGLLQPETAKTMHDTTLTIVPPLNRMALGFYEQDLNGRRALAHGGDTTLFHSDLWIVPSEELGVFVSLNSSGTPGSVRALRGALFQQFGDRYFPVERPQQGVDDATAKQHAAMMAGYYTNSRGGATNFLRILDLIGQSKLGVTEDGRLLSGDVISLGDAPRRWIEVAPFVWRDADSGERIAAKVESGKVVRWSFDTVSPFMMFDRAPWWRDSGWLLPATMAAIGVLLLTALAWPVRALARRRFKATHPLEGASRRHYRLTNAFAWLSLAVLAGWATFVLLGLSYLTLLNGALDPLVIALQVLTPIAQFGLLGLAGWNVWRVFREARGWGTKVWSVLLLLAAVVLLWVGLVYKLIGWGLTY